MDLKREGEDREFSTGAVRDTKTGKGRYDLLPPRAIHKLAIQFEAGANKYSDRNWEKGMPIGEMIDSGLRHAMQYLSGYTDEDHLVSAAWNLMCALELRERIKEGVLPEELDDISKQLGELIWKDSANAE